MKIIAKICLFFSVLSLGSCVQNENNLYYGLAHKEIEFVASKANTPFVIVLVDSNQHLSKEYIKLLNEEYKQLTNNAIFNIIDLNMDDKWYLKWLNPTSIPLACVFSSTGNLIDLIPGFTKESFLYTEEAIVNTRITGFHWQNVYGIEKLQIIPLLNKLLEQKKNADEGIYITSEINDLVNSLPQPYSMYIKLNSKLKNEDLIAAKEVARSLLEYISPYNLDLYKSEFVAAKRVLDPNFNIKSEPHIRLEQQNLSLGSCQINSRTAFELTIYNDGGSPLKIENIQMSCTCLESIGPLEEIIIEANERYVVKFYLIPEKEGVLSRDMVIISNAVNHPILDINIVATGIKM